VSEIGDVSPDFQGRGERQLTSDHAVEKKVEGSWFMSGMTPCGNCWSMARSGRSSHSRRQT
jgi:hypothetical protein